ncbi:phage terminase small subunit [Domibacillus aminovorans]|uniref:phage terminase small subunit n=1 Tax=Domibacillus aminovorans TaxID=29332 RepID=UPI0009EE95E0|nr:phage terminase small subunit [Domibacillus aminovorans]
MPRARDPNRDKAYELYKQHNGDITNRAIADQLGIDEKKVAVWKQRDKWNVIQQSEHNVVQQSDEKRNRGAPVGNSNGKGNRGNKHAAPPKQNSNALKHGFYAKHLPEEFLEIMEEVRQTDPLDLIWEQIVIQYTAIIRAQKIMWVESGDDHLKEESGSSWGDTGGSKSHKVSFAYEQYYAYLSAQSRAMAELRNLIKQFNEQAHIHDERRLKLEGMQTAIAKSKAEVEKLTNNNNEGPIEIVIKRRGEAK